MNAALPRAVGITAALAAAGLSENALAWWFSRPRRELDGHSPRSWLLTGRGDEPVLALARQDAADLDVQVARAPRLTSLDRRVLGEMNGTRGVRARRIATRLAGGTTGYDEVRGILRGLEHLGYCTGQGGWWRLLGTGTLSADEAPEQAAEGLVEG